MESTWDIHFTSGFKSDIKKLEKTGASKWLEKLDFLKQGPLLKSNNLKALKARSNSYRWRQGDIRVIFRLLTDTKVILLLRAGQRKDVYKKTIPASDNSVGLFENYFTKKAKSAFASNGWKIKQESSQKQQFDVDDLFGHVEDPEVVIEELFIDEYELFLIGIPDEYHEVLTDCESIEDAKTKGIKASVLERIEDYLTSPGQSQVGRIYSLDCQDGVSAIAEQPLQEFLVALDPQQKRIVNKKLDQGPWMIRGGPGTGKTLINLARIKRIIDENVGEDLYTRATSHIGFVTFNKALSQSAESMFAAICRDKPSINLEFKTLDGIVYSLARQVSSTGSKTSKDNKVYLDAIDQALCKVDLTQFSKEDVSNLRFKRGLKFLHEEFETVIFGNDLLKLDDYESFNRKGRKLGLRRADRPLVHHVFRLWVTELRALKLTTFAAKRLKVLKELEKKKLQVTQYDFLFVDELQDLSVVAIRLLTHLVPHVSRLSFSADTAQSIYLKAPSWSNIAPSIRFHKGNSYILRKSYRMTQQISNAIAPLRLDAGDGESENDAVTESLFSGALPKWVNCHDAEHPEAVAVLISCIYAERSINLSQFAVITPDADTSRAVANQMAVHGVKHYIVSKNNKIELTENRVNILNVHVAKGLEFPFVFVVSVVDGKYPQFPAINNCIDEKEIDEEFDRARRLLYVALSRASSELWMFTDATRSCSLLADLNSVDWDCR